MLAPAGQAALGHVTEAERVLRELEATSVRAAYAWLSDLFEREQGVLAAGA